MGPTEKQKEILSVPDAYRRGDRYVVLTGNPQWERDPFTLVFVSCRQSYYKTLRDRLEALAARHAYLSVHAVPWVYDTFAIIRGSMPHAGDWLWENLIDPLRAELNVSAGVRLRQTDIDLIVMEVNPTKLRWFANDFHQERDTVTVHECDRAQAARMIGSYRGKLVGNANCESDLVYALVTTTGDAQLRLVRDALVAEPKVRDVFELKPEGERKHTERNSGEPGEPIKSPFTKGVFSRADVFEAVQLVAVLDITTVRHHPLQQLYKWRTRFQQQYAGVEIELMPAIAEYEGVEFKSPHDVAADVFFGVDLPVDLPRDDDEVPH
ncbi:MAG TPA: hypothetical protein VEK11_13220 [Thermoanaerobaculia bacterium]|nr:hypothetical protein [Thermoanaerobaculia bacterium]